MKDSGLCLGALLGGIFVGCALTMLHHSKTAAEMRQGAHSKILEELAFLRQHVCKCGEEESICSMEGCNNTPEESQG